LNDVAIIGAGPTGISASIYLKRAGFDVTVFEKNIIGGLLNNAFFVENYPGFPDGIKGNELCNLMTKHFKRWSININNKEVINIKSINNNFEISTINITKTYKSVIVATGTTFKKLDISIDNELLDKFVFYEIKNLLPRLKPGNKCIVIGGGDAAFDYSLNLEHNKANVEIFYRSNKPKCLPLLEKRVKNCKNIKVHKSQKPLSIVARKGKPEINFKSSLKNKDIRLIKSDFVLIACGRKPNNILLENFFKKSNIPGLYIAGDVKNKFFRQVGIAVGEGIYAAMNVEKYLRGKTK